MGYLWDNYHQNQENRIPKTESWDLAPKDLEEDGQNARLGLNGDLPSKKMGYNHSWYFMGIL